MRIAVAASGKGLDAPAVTVFGRAPYFVIVEVSDGDVKLVENVQNPGVSSGKGAGMLAAQTVINKGVNAVVSGTVGPNAYSVLAQAGIRLYLAVPGTVRDNAVAATRGALQEVTKPAGRHGHRWGWRAQW